ncbi:MULTISPECIES: nuclear transport factor 2 family protein [unclassified Roseateles]|uniref:nuclear transport factor 2 family protein n=1 Tax=unclassified Roseateles TaxID=2626991 RepID=UPI0006FE1882|nr:MULTISPECIES: nuclear transport factor 2 family protein [unclassified Roseateles]
MKASIPVFLLAAAVHLSAAAQAPMGLSSADASWNELRLKSDVAGLDRLLAPDWLLTHSDGRVQDKRDYLGELASRGRTNQVILNEDVVVRGYGNTAVVTGVSVQSGVSQGTPWSGRFRFTRVWVLVDNSWKMVSSHSSRISSPPDSSNAAVR